MMISVVIASVKPELSQALRDNIEQTIGVPHEIWIHDNRHTQWGLCRLYNHYARLSQGRYIAFLHEDIHIYTSDWGRILVDFYGANPQAGVVGFAGSTLKTRTLSGWESTAENSRMCLRQHIGKGHVQQICCNVHGEDYAQVLALDGFAFIVPRDVWQQHPYDEALLSAYNQYEIHFSLQVALTHSNYVCFTIDVEHFSCGRFERRWYDDALRLHRKWSDRLPWAIGACTARDIRRAEARAAYMLARAELKHRWYRRSLACIVRERLRPSLLTPWDSLYTLKLIKYLLRAL
ncbi:MAG: glycosyltransferase family protein [Tannerellaceae bacterium]|jgi:hypothetical protein|nr:glycosyltransferase family protein [Tannerellaceae bacterium]